MRKISSICFAGWLLCFASLSANAQGPLKTAKRIVFLGNSITWQGTYITDIEAYYATHYPDSHPEFINVGLPSETVSGLSEPDHAGGSFPRPDLHERLGRVLAQTKPDLVFTCYGMNDGIYLPFSDERFRQFKAGINWLHQEVEKTGARIIHLTPPDYDELKGKKVGYTAVLDRYSAWLLSLRKSAGWRVIDIHSPMKNYLAAHRKVDATFAIDGFALAPDGIHPGETGHWIMARAMLTDLGCKDAAKARSITDALTATPNGQQILKLIADRQTMMRDAWLTATKHKRPGLPVGLPLDSATVRANTMAQEIQALRQLKPAGN